MIELIRQLVQHNLRVIEKYYSRISLARMSQLVGVSIERTENELGDMVVNGRIGAKINRLAGIVTINKRKQFTNERLNSEPMMNYCLLPIGVIMFEYTNS